MKKRIVRIWLLAGFSAAVLVSGGVALAAFPDSNVETYTGCVNLAGEVGSLALGANPLRACTSPARVVHLSGGDITRVTAGAGLSGGGDNGAVTLNLDAGHSLPQGCGSGQVPKATGTASWSCGTDANTTYAAGTGVDVTGSTISVKGGYRLPQGCSDGQAPVRTLAGPADWGCASFAGTDTHCATGSFATGIDASGTVTCASGGSRGLGTAYQTSHSGDAPQDADGLIDTLSLPAGVYVVTATGYSYATDGDVVRQDCSIRKDGFLVDAESTREQADGNTPPSVPFSMSGTVDATADATVTVVCEGFAVPDQRAYATLTAMAVGSVVGQ